MPTPQEMRVQRTFDKAMDQINNLQKVFRDEGMMAKAVVDIGGNQDFGAIQEAFDNLYGALEDAHYDAMAHIDVENKKQELGMNKEPVAELQTGDDVKEDDEEIQAIPSKVVELAGDSIWDRDGSNPKSVKVSKVSILDPYSGSDPYMSDDEDDGYRKVDVEHDGPWSIYTDSGFEAAISKMVGFEVSFTEQGMQEDGMASMEGTMGDAMESVSVTEGYEGKVLGILKKEGIDAYFSGGKLYVDQADMSEAKSILADNDDIKELPDMVAETLHEGGCGCDACADKKQKMSADDELQLLLKRAGIR
tara:strand:+ start:33699 stop:34613 length:915 start_codon:yes stop_codon:yes gene_type:complete